MGLTPSGHVATNVAFAPTTHFRRTFVIAKEEALEFTGTVSAVLGNSNFRVELENGHEVLATIAGKMRRFRIRVLEGDRVTIEVSPYDLNRGRITYRHKS